MSDHVRRWAPLIVRAANHWHIDAADLGAVIFHESRGDEGLTSSAGAKGLTQFMPGTATGYHVNTSPGHAWSQINGAAHYLSDLGYHKDRRRALASYAAGPGNVAAGWSYADAIDSLKHQFAYLRSASTATATPVAQRAAHATHAAQPTVTGGGLNIDQALLDSLGDHHGSLAHDILGRLSSGAYDRPLKVSTPAATNTPVQRAAHASSQANPTAGFKATHWEGTQVPQWMVPALNYARAHGWTGKIVSGVRTYQEQVGLYARYKNSGFNHAYLAAPPGQSNHEIENGGAIDVTNPAELNQILSHYPGRRPLWGYPTIGDFPHFSSNGH